MNSIPTMTISKTATPSATRVAAQPAPEVLLDAQHPNIGRTTEVEMIVEETLAGPAPTDGADDDDAYEDEREYKTIRRASVRPPSRWLW